MAEQRNNIPDQYRGETSVDFVYPEAEVSTWNPYTSGALALEIAAAMEEALPTEIQAGTDPSTRPDPETDGRYRIDARNIVTQNEVEARPVDHLAELGKLGTTIAELRQAHRNDFDLAA